MSDNFWLDISDYDVLQFQNLPFWHLIFLLNMLFSASGDSFFSVLLLPVYDGRNYISCPKWIFCQIMGEIGSYERDFIGLKYEWNSLHERAPNALNFERCDTGKELERKRI